MMVEQRGLAHAILAEQREDFSAPIEVTSWMTSESPSPLARFATSSAGAVADRVPHQAGPSPVDGAHELRPDDFGHGAVQHELPLVQHDDARADLAHEVEIVLDQQDAEPILRATSRPGCGRSTCARLWSTPPSARRAAAPGARAPAPSQAPALASAVRKVARFDRQLLVQASGMDHLQGGPGSASVARRDHKRRPSVRARAIRSMRDGQGFEHGRGLKLPPDAESDARVRGHGRDVVVR